ncbi:LOW QUALITY PROTEIN: hypothetical protein Cgig2_027933 [Carnegiea gigantea]|uniref:Uncharacterized protein n=1 Tax=Carnegiea gigantea TaxID=171969 RepID=A0A9Q1KM85_9CARY|nr:LOW QUALITY PROTEIN: hypothetical protein Cgig2_027933 [Carnegiea gigantea]
MAWSSQRNQQANKAEKLEHQPPQRPSFDLVLCDIHPDRKVDGEGPESDGSEQCEDVVEEGHCHGQCGYHHHKQGPPGELPEIILARARPMPIEAYPKDIIAATVDNQGQKICNNQQGDWKVIPENITRVANPPIHPSCAVPHASDNTPDPIIAVMMWALAVHTVPVKSCISIYFSIIANLISQKKINVGQPPPPKKKPLNEENHAIS